jgi:hypothetical protein
MKNFNLLTYIIIMKLKRKANKKIIKLKFFYCRNISLLLY